MMSTSTRSPSRIAPTSFQRYEFMAKISGAPMPAEIRVKLARG